MKHTSMTEDDVNTFRCISAIDKSNGENHYRSLLQQPIFCQNELYKPDTNLPVKTI